MTAAASLPQTLTPYCGPHRGRHDRRRTPVRSLSEQVLTERLKDLAHQKEKLNRGCPQIPSWAYERARKGIEAGEGGYTVDKTDPPSPSPTCATVTCPDRFREKHSGLRGSMIVTRSALRA